MKHNPAQDLEQCALPAALEAMGEKWSFLILRGALSDILVKPAAQKMAKALPKARLVEVPGIGHAPTMDEARARTAIGQWVAELPAT